MLALLLKRWWPRGGAAQGWAVPFEVECRCGHRLRGQRRDNFQVVLCTRCGRPVFVLGCSPLPPLAGQDRLSQAPPGGWSGFQPWLVPLAAVGLTAALVVLLFVFWIMPWLFPSLNSQTGQPGAGASPSPSERLHLARQHLQQGHFRLATQLLQAEPDSRHLQDLTAEQRRQWPQLQREAALLTDLLTEPLEDVLRHAAGVAEAEWQADFPHRYQGKAILLDAEVKRQPDGRLEIAYQLRLGTEAAQLEVSDLDLLRQVKLDQPRRLLFGARLATVRPEPPGPTWVVRLQPDSGVWLTDPAAAALCCPAWSDAATRALLQEQAGWWK